MPVALNLPISSLCTHAHNGRGGGRKEKDFRLQQNQHLSLALVGVRDRFHTLGQRKNIFCSTPDVLGCLMPKTVLNPLMKLGCIYVTS